MQALDYGSQCLLPLLYRSSQCFGDVGERAGILSGAYRRAQYANSILLRRGSKALHTLHVAGIDALLMRGVAMLATYGHERVLRPVTEADVFVCPRQIREAVAVLGIHGWRSPLRQHLQGGVVRTHDRWVLLDADGTQLSLHWRWLPATAVANADDTDARPWDAARRLSIAGETITVMDVADILLDTCIEAGGWSATARTGHIADALLIVRHAANLDWARLVRHARQHGVVPPVLATLAGVHDDLGGAVPEQVLAELTAARTTIQQRLEFYCRRSVPLRLWPLADLWFCYRRDRHDQPVAAKGLGFIRYLQLRWGVSSVGEVAFVAASRLSRTMARGLGRRRYPEDAAR
jgi:Uncharacterised nucleotidyltransferase